MSVPLLKSDSASQSEPECANDSPIHRVLWAVLPAMLALIVIGLRFFGFSWWTALLVTLLLACPAAIAMYIYTCFYCKPSAPPNDSNAGRGGGNIEQTK
jgi:uncharacterized membrane protein YdbT with pleckstrin-like domain